MSSWKIVEHSWKDIGIYTDTGKQICMLSLDDDCDEEKQDILELEQLTNARLIASAPELLEALEWALSEIEESTQPYEWSCGYSSELHYKARTAIAKARGKLIYD